MLIHLHFPRLRIAWSEDTQFQAIFVNFDFLEIWSRELKVRVTSIYADSEAPVEIARLFKMEVFEDRVEWDDERAKDSFISIFLLWNHDWILFIRQIIIERFLKRSAGLLNLAKCIAWTKGPSPCLVDLSATVTLLLTIRKHILPKLEYDVWLGVPRRNNPTQHQSQSNINDLYHWPKYYGHTSLHG